VNESINVILTTYERPERFRVAVASAFCHIPNIGQFVVVQQSDYDPALLSPRLTIIRAAPTRNCGTARNLAIDYLAEQIDPEAILFVMDDDMEILPGFAAGLPFVFDLLRRTNTGLIHCAMMHKPAGKSREVTWGIVGGGVFARLSTMVAIGGWGTDTLDDVHTFIKSLMAGFRNYRTAQIRNSHFVGSPGGLRLAWGGGTQQDKRRLSRSNSKLNELYPGLFSRWEPERRVFDINLAALPAKRP
jgi:hypothetical protein